MKEINEKELEMAAGGENTENLKKHRSIDPACANFDMPEYENLKKFQFINFTCSMCNHARKTEDGYDQVYCALGL